MTESIMLINETDDECRIAIAVDNVLQDLLIEHSVSGQIKNNIYRGTVVQVQTSLQAAFVDYGEKKHGFLPNSELNADLIGNRKFHKSDPIQHKLKVGQTILVQVTREAVDHKGSALTTNITLPGRFMVLMPNSNKGGISKKIDDQKERDRLKGFLSGIEAEEHAVIIRTAGIGRSLTELKRDYTALKKTWNDIYTTFEKEKQPGLILAEADVVTRTMRDYYTEEISEVWVDNPETFQKALKFFKEVAPRRQKDLKLFVGDRSLFATYNIERQVEQLTSNEVKLRSGGSIVIDQTEALVAIDVNSGKSNQEGNIDSTALRTNLEAAEEIARQLRLRNLGGLIVVDFIDMDNESYRHKVEEKMSDAMMMDKAQTRFNPISQFGLLEMSRQRLAVGISHTVESVCPICLGKGKLPSLLASTNQIIRSIREIAAKGNITAIEGELPLELVNHLLNERRQSISDLELEFGIEILLRGNPELLVFQERFIKPVYQKGKAPQPSKKEKPESKKRTKKQHQPKEQASKKPEREKKADKRQQEQPEKEPVVSKEVKVEEPVKPQTPQETPEESSLLPDIPTENKNGTTSDFGIHPACLFQDVQELDEEELDEVTTAFGNRLKGKIDNTPPQMIDDKYLWKTYINGNDTKVPEESDKAEENVEETIAAEKKTPSKPRRRGRSRKPKTETPKADLENKEESEDSTPQKKRKPSRKTSAKKPAKTNAEEAQVEEVPEESTEAAKEKPAKKSSRSRSSRNAKAKKAEAATASQPEEEDAKQEKVKKNTRSKKASTEKADKTVQVTEEKPKKTSTRGRKKTAVKDEGNESKGSSTEKAKETKTKTAASKSTQKAPAKRRASSKASSKKKADSQDKES